MLVDQSRFDARFVPPAFEQQPDEWSSFRAPVSAIALDRNALTFDVVAQSAGAPARVLVLPAGFARLESAVKTTPPGSGQAVGVALRPEGTRLVAALAGHVAEGVPRVRLTRRIDDPRLFAGHVLFDMLRGLGVEIRGSVREGGSEVVERLVFHQSAPLGALRLRARQEQRQLLRGDDAEGAGRAKGAARYAAPTGRKSWSNGCAKPERSSRERSSGTVPGCSTPTA